MISFKVLFLPLFTIASLASFEAYAKKANLEKNCDVCEQAAKAQEVFKSKPDEGIKAGIKILDTYQAHKDPQLTLQEIHSLTSLAALLLPKNDEGQIDDLFYDIYRDHQKLIDADIELRPEHERKILRDSLKQMQEVSDDGNG
ncbi:MAG: hypothetical protein ACK5P7_00005 [Bdellovibrio sp.]